MTEAKKYPAPKMVDRKCKSCGDPFKAREVDVKRGWGLFCSKSCKAIKQEKRTGQYRNLLASGSDRYDDDDQSWDAHKEITFL